jgi:hypothetical protein
MKLCLSLKTEKTEDKILRTLRPKRHCLFIRLFHDAVPVTKVMQRRMACGAIIMDAEFVNA